MGYIRHHAIIITCFRDEDIHEIQELIRVCGLDDLASPPIQGRTNGYWTILIAPDGSKEGWETSDEAEKQREVLIECIKTANKTDLTFSEWVSLVSYDEEGPPYILDSHYKFMGYED